MDDLIRRADAIDGLDGHRVERRNLNDWQEGWNDALDWVQGCYLEDLPSAQPETHEKRTETHACDTISRQAAIDILKALIPLEGIFVVDPIVGGALIAVKEAIAQLPSAQPEIIRCKDCKYGSPNKVYGCRLDPFSVHDRDSRMYADDFCSRAERREG